MTCHKQIKPTPLTKKDKIWCKCLNDVSFAVKEPTQTIALSINRKNVSEELASKPRNGKRQGPNI